MDTLSTPHELEGRLGEQVKTLRLLKNLDRQTVCAQAGVSVTALRHLEDGKGATIKTLVRVLKALDREGWLTSLLPPVSINPLHMVRDKKTRQRASRRNKGEKEKV